MSTLITNARLFTAVDERVIEQGALLIEGGEIQYAGPAADLPETENGTEIRDVGGRFVMPGMTETHAHLSFADASPFAIGATPVEEATITAVRNAKLMLSSGFTSAISFGSTYKIDVAPAGGHRIRAHSGPTPDGCRARSRRHGQQRGFPGGLSQIADGPWALRKAVREQRRDGVDVVKIFIDGEAINPVNPPGRTGVLRRGSERRRGRGPPPRLAGGLPRTQRRCREAGRARGGRLCRPCQLPGRGSRRSPGLAQRTRVRGPRNRLGSAVRRAVRVAGRQSRDRARARLRGRDRSHGEDRGNVAQGRC